jgi:hypothetical protein
LGITGLESRPGNRLLFIMFSIYQLLLGHHYYHGCLSSFAPHPPYSIVGLVTKIQTDSSGGDPQFIITNHSIINQLTWNLATLCIWQKPSQCLPARSTP